MHKRIRSTCKDCGGGSICLHNRRRSRCKDCKGCAVPGRLFHSLLIEDTNVQLLAVRYVSKVNLCWGQRGSIYFDWVQPFVHDSVQLQVTSGDLFRRDRAKCRLIQLRLRLSDGIHRSSIPYTGSPLYCRFHQVCGTVGHSSPSVINRSNPRWWCGHIRGVGGRLLVPLRRLFRQKMGTLPSGQSASRATHRALSQRAIPGNVSCGTRPSPPSMCSGRRFR